MISQSVSILSHYPWHPIPNNFGFSANQLTLYIMFFGQRHHECFNKMMKMPTITTKYLAPGHFPLLCLLTRKKANV